MTSDRIDSMCETEMNWWIKRLSDQFKKEKEVMERKK